MHNYVSEKKNKENKPCFEKLGKPKKQKPAPPNLTLTRLHYHGLLTKS